MLRVYKGRTQSVSDMHFIKNVLQMGLDLTCIDAITSDIDRTSCKSCSNRIACHDIKKAIEFISKTYE